MTTLLLSLFACTNYCRLFSVKTALHLLPMTPILTPILRSPTSHASRFEFFTLFTHNRLTILQSTTPYPSLFQLLKTNVLGILILTRPFHRVVELLSSIKHKFSSEIIYVPHDDLTVYRRVLKGHTQHSRCMPDEHFRRSLLIVNTVNLSRLESGKLC